jgi:hypothetical protein
MDGLGVACLAASGTAAELSVDCEIAVAGSSEPSGTTSALTGDGGTSASANCPSRRCREEFEESAAGSAAGTRTAAVRINPNAKLDHSRIAALRSLQSEIAPSTSPVHSARPLCPSTSPVRVRFSAAPFGHTTKRGSGVPMTQPVPRLTFLLSNFEFCGSMWESANFEGQGTHRLQRYGCEDQAKESDYPVRGLEGASAGNRRIPVWSPPRRNGPDSICSSIKKPRTQIRTYVFRAPGSLENRRGSDDREWIGSRTWGSSGIARSHLPDSEHTTSYSNRFPGVRP